MPSLRRTAARRHECDHCGDGERHDLCHQTFQIADTGTHRYFLVFQPAAGRPENNFFNLNSVEFVGAGVGT